MGRSVSEGESSANGLPQQSSTGTTDQWYEPLPNVITPKRGPLSPMTNLIETRKALLDLPTGYLRRAHWLTAGKALLTAAETGKPADIQRVYDAIVVALEAEGWLSLSSR